MKSLLFELCAPSFEAALAGDRGGADRIELCTNLPVGGVTPDEALLLSVIRAVSIPVHVLIRPRAGDFVFSAQEFAVMTRQIEAARAAGASGVAIGVLLPDSRVDVERSRALAELARPMHVTFHRAFDETPNLAEALEDVIETGAGTLLTSGGAPDALAGAERIARLCSQAGARLEIMAGGGIRLENLSELVRRCGALCLHGSLSHPSAENGHGTSVDGLEHNIRKAVQLLHATWSPASEVSARN